MENIRPGPSAFDASIESARRLWQEQVAGLCPAPKGVQASPAFKAAKALKESLLDT
jgi:hypothetical protein